MNTLKRSVASLATLSLLIVFSLTGCDTVALDKEQPEQSVSPEAATGSERAIEALLNNTYDRLQGAGRYGQFFMLVPDALADNTQLSPTANSNRYLGYTSNTQGQHLNNWGNSYGGINEANLVLANIVDLNIQLPEENEAAFRNRIRGQALFMRSLEYFDLIRTKAYEPGQEVAPGDIVPAGADVPSGWTPQTGVVIRTEPTDNIDKADPLPRSTTAEVYELLETDLTEAASLLEQAEESGTPQGATEAPVRVSSAAAHGLLARVYLYQGKWAEAEASASAAITAANGFGIAIASGTSETGWDAGSIFRLTMTQGQNATGSTSSLRGLTDETSPSLAFEVIPSEDLVSLFEPSDTRNALLQEATRSGQTFTYARKYIGKVGTYADPIPVMRIEEMYLIRAEARAEQGNIQSGLSDLNEIRTNRGIDAIAFGTGADEVDTTAELVDEVYEERRRELFLEGHRFFDLKRRGLDIPKPQSGSVIEYEDFRILAQLPPVQVQTNDLLVQNPGY